MVLKPDVPNRFKSMNAVTDLSGGPVLQFHDYLQSPVGLFYDTELEPTISRKRSYHLGLRFHHKQIGDE